MFRVRILLGLLSLLALIRGCVAADAGSEAGRYFVSSFSSKAYGASPQDWAIIQDPDGVMYFGNTDGVLEFDGVRWRQIPVSGSSAWALAEDGKGKIYVGGDNVFGYLAPDDTGTPKFVSVVGQIAPPDRHFGVIRKILAASDGVYFLSQTRLFRLRPNGQIRVWSEPGNFRRLLFEASGKVYLGSGAGFLRVEDENIVPVNWGNAVVNDRPKTSVSWRGSVLVASANRIYQLKDGLLEPFPNVASKFLSEHKIEVLSTLPNGDLAVGTIAGGLVILDEEHHSFRTLDKAAGLPSNLVTAFLPARDGNSWVATNAGLARFATSLTNFSEAQGLAGNVYSLIRHDGALYAGTTAGLFRLDTEPSRDPVFKPVQAVKTGTTFWSMASCGSVSVAGADDGIYQISNDGVDQILRERRYVYDVHCSAAEPNLMYAATRDGVLALRRDGSAWSLIAHERGDGQDFRTIAEEEDGRVWATTRANAWRFDFRSTPVKAERFDNRDGLPANWKNVYRFRNHIVFGTDKGLMKFVESSRRFVPDCELGSQFCDKSKPVFLLQEDSRQNVWISGKGYHGVLRKTPSGQDRWFEMPLIGSGIEDIWALHVDDDGTAWASGSEGALFRWDPHESEGSSPDPKVFIRELRVGEGKSVLFGGSGALPANLEIPYSQNAVRFEFVAPFFAAPLAVEYQYTLEGAEKHWSLWTPEPQKDFTNLPPHHFRFRIRARNPHGFISPETSLEFRVLPPWYRTWWAYTLYFADAALLSWLVFRWRVRVLREHNQQLERIVEERTKQVRVERDQNEALLQNILPASIASELRDHGSVTPTMFEEVTVCFTDFVGFTLSSETLSADRLVTALNRYFTAFDSIMLRYGLEKLKTIGDSYMFASGLPEQRPSHAVDAVLAALEMVHLANGLQDPGGETNWSMRIGLYSGPVVAGVVGKSKFAFDIWGNTVNLASRMESSGAPNRVNLSSITCNYVGEFIDCEPRGLVRIKEGREMEMYFVTGVKPTLLSGALVNGVPSAFAQKYEQAFGRPPLSFPSFLL